jgi:tetratricopeptide (TPR) repeat protein
MTQKNNLQPTKAQVSALIKQGTLLHQQANFDEAQAIYEKILHIQPDHFDALQLLGVLFAQVKKYVQAVELLSKALEINPNHAGAYSNRGIALKELKRFDEALANYDQAIANNPGYLDAYSNRGNLLQELKRFDEALANYDQAIKINPDYVDAYINRGNLLRDLKRFDEALASYDQATKVNPDSVANTDPIVEAYYNRGTILQELKRFHDALANYDQAIKINPDYVEAYVDRGVALKKLNQFDGALANYDQAIKINPDYAEAYYNRGTILQELKRFNEAIASYDQAIKINPDYVNAQWNASICNLKNGNFKAGWPGYEMRWKHFQCNSEPLKSAKPVWDFKKTNQRLLVWAEMGIGDHIFFGSLLSELLEDVPNLLVQIDKRLIPIFTRSLPKIKFYPDSLILPESDYDIHVPIGSLGKYLRNNEKDFLLRKNKFFISDEIRTQTIRQELPASKKLICGVSWKSSAGATGINRSLSLEKLAAIFDPDKISLVNLQYGDVSKEIDLLKTNIELIQYKSIDNFDDLDGVASLIDACDFIVSVDNSIIHLSSALGKKTFILLSYIPEWRILFNRDDSPWYPSAKLYRQERLGDWDAPLEKLKTDLLNFITLVSQTE